MKRKYLAVVFAAASLFTAGATLANESTAIDARDSLKAAAASGISPAQRAMLNEKLALIDNIMHAAQADMLARGVTADQRKWLLESLYAMPLAQVRALGTPGSFSATANAVASTKADMRKAGEAQPALGQLTTELVYYPFTPCRFIDTRNVGGPIVGSRQFDLDVAGDTFGGSATCNPVTLSGIGTSGNGAAVAINLAIIGPPGAPGFVGARPVGSGTVIALVNWYEAGPNVQASNAAVVSYDQQAIVTNEIEFFGSTTNIVVDVFGIFGAPTATALQCQNTANIATPVNAGANFSLNAGACPAGFTSVSVNCRTSLFNTVNYASVGANTGGADCQGTNISGGQITMNVSQLCCRVPGR